MNIIILHVDIIYFRISMQVLGANVRSVYATIQKDTFENHKHFETNSKLNHRNMIYVFKTLLKAEDYSYMYSAHIKGRSRCYASLYCEEYGHFRTWNKMYYIGIETVQQNIYYNWKTNNKSFKIINTITCIRYILVVCVMQPSQWHTLPAS